MNNQKYLSKSDINYNKPDWASSEMFYGAEFSIIKLVEIERRAWLNDEKLLAKMASQLLSIKIEETSIDELEYTISDLEMQVSNLEDERSDMETRNEELLSKVTQLELEIKTYQLLLPKEGNQDGDPN